MRFGSFWKRHSVSQSSSTHSHIELPRIGLTPTHVRTGSSLHMYWKVPEKALSNS